MCSSLMIVFCLISCSESLLVSKIVVSSVFVVRNRVPNAFLKIVTFNEHACILMLWCLCPECVEGLKGVKDLIDVWIMM